jgi:hypothetical protein
MVESDMPELSPGGSAGVSFVRAADKHRPRRRNIQAGARRSSWNSVAFRCCGWRATEWQVRDGFERDVIDCGKSLHTNSCAHESEWGEDRQVRAGRKAKRIEIQAFRSRLSAFGSAIIPLDS